ncbi:MAG: DUF86 domain-containing protein [Oscillospiraceae bacterium]|jgi:uncharacterized protein with HEPN domain|nr:DUF86 domain-containing protein [Oscillospiraceae bacterium]
MKEYEKTVLKKIRDYSEQAIFFIENMDFISFSNDAKTIAACVMNLSQIGELTTRLDDEFINTYNQIPWRKMKGMRNRIVHDYDGIQFNIVWDVLTDFLPELIENIDEIM